MEDEISDQWGCEKTGEGKYVGDRVYVFVRGEGEETGFEGRFEGMGAVLALVWVGR